MVVGVRDQMPRSVWSIAVMSLMGRTSNCVWRESAPRYSHGSRVNLIKCECRTVLLGLEGTTELHCRVDHPYVVIEWAKYGRKRKDVVDPETDLLRMAYKLKYDRDGEAHTKTRHKFRTGEATFQLKVKWVSARFILSCNWLR